MDQYGLKDREVWITGESYGGVYVPQLAYHIHNFNNDSSTAEGDKIKLKGMLVGNGMTNYTYDATPASVEYAYYRGLLDTNTWDEMVSNNCVPQYSWMAPSVTDKCNELLNKWGVAVTNIDIYNIYGECASNTQEAVLAAQDPAKREKMIVNEAGETLTVTSDGRSATKSKGYFTQYDYTPWAFGPLAKKENFKLTPPCVYSANIDAYLSDSDVIG